MIRQEAILQSPLRILDKSIRGGLGRGHLGVIMAPPGVGKSACLAQIGLDALLRGRAVLHVALRQPIEHVTARYDALFHELARRVDLADRRGVSESITRRRLVWSSLEGGFDGRELDRAIGAFRANLGHDPAVVLVDGFGWVEPGGAGVLAALKASAVGIGAELWMTAREAHGPGTQRLHPPAPLSDGCAGQVDIGIFLEPHGSHARLTLVKDHERFPGSHVALVLEGGLLRLWDDDGPAPAERDAADFTLLASASPGAEEVFGACAERWGVGEVNFTFAGRQGAARTRGLVELPEDELRAGDVAPRYVRVHLHRALAESPGLKPVLQAIWHQVSSAGEVFAVGTLHPDKTAKGGTGWAVELARHWGKPVHLFDQDRRGWFRWTGADWVPVPPPAITRERFAGAGTRTPTPEARAEIRALFERSFGPPEP